MTGSLLYLHGFTSGPASHKAQVLKARMAGRGLAAAFLCPQLPYAPGEAADLIESLILAARAPVTLVGSSLGGYYATYFAERHGLKAVLVNPAVIAHLQLADYVGRHANLYSGEEFDFTPEHIEQLRRLEVPRLAHPENFWVLLETGDETLDYRQAVAKYAGARQTVLEGGDHSFTRWGEYLDEVIDFAGVGVSARPGRDMNDNPSCPPRTAPDHSGVAVAELASPQPLKDYREAMHVADAEATSRLGRHMLLSWYDRDRDFESPQHSSECHAAGAVPGYVDYGVNHGASLMVNIEDGRFVFFYLPLE